MSNYVKKDIYYCYSIKVFHFLKENGFYYIYKEKHHTTGKYFWAFERNEELDKALTAYSLVRDTFK
jgi:hypothetical protein